MLEEAINDRRIKNAMKEAKLLAAAEDDALNVAHINRTIGIVKGRPGFS